MQINASLQKARLNFLKLRNPELRSITLLAKNTVISTCYIYADGSDLMESRLELRLRIESFAALYGDRVRVVDQREEEKPNSDDLPNWDLGVNFEFDALSDAEKKDIALFFQSLSGEFGRDFIIGGVLPSGQADDFIAISATESLDPVLSILIGNEN